MMAGTWGWEFGRWEFFGHLEHDGRTSRRVSSQHRSGMGPRGPLETQTAYHSERRSGSHRHTYSFFPAIISTIRRLTIEFNHNRKKTYHIRTHKRHQTHHQPRTALLITAPLPSPASSSPSPPPSPSAPASSSPQCLTSPSLSPPPPPPRSAYPTSSIRSF